LSDNLPINIEVDPVELINGFLDCYKDITINRDIQDTEKTRIREYAKLLSKNIESNTKKYELVINQISKERTCFVETICSIATSPDLDENSLKICTYLLSYLQNDRYLDIPIVEMPLLK